MEIVKKNYHNYVPIWLLIMIILVFLMIVVGGLTRLTDSGLSITKWELFKGIIPPLTKNDWVNYFSLYKELPQFKLMYPTMSLEEFKVFDSLGLRGSVLDGLGAVLGGLGWVSGGLVLGRSWVALGGF